MSSSSFKRGLFGAISLVCCLVLAGCASAPSGSGTSSTRSDKSDVEQPGKFADGSSMKNIQDRGKLIVGLPMDRPPFASRNVNTGSIQGFDIEIARLIAAGIFGAQIEGKVEFIEIDPRDRTLLLEQNRIDIAMGRFEITVPDKRFVDFAGPYFTAKQQLLVDDQRSQNSSAGGQANVRITSASQLSNQKVCVVRGSTKIDAIKTAIPGVDTSMVKTSVEQCVAEVGAKTVPAVIADKTDLLPYAKSDSGAGRLRNVSLPNVPDSPYGIGVSRERTDLRTFLNDRLEVIVKDGRWKDAYEATIKGDDKPPAVERY